MQTAVVEKPLTEGETVFIRNTNMAGKVIIEGEAVIVRKTGGDHYKVQFRGERHSFTRFVLPEHRRKEPV